MQCDARASPDDWNAARPAGLDCAKDWEHPNDKSNEGTGKGTDSTVYYSPWVWPDQGNALCNEDNNAGNSSDEVLLHELVHSMEQVEGKLDQCEVYPPRFDPTYATDNVAEFFAVLVANLYSSETGRKLRQDHRSFKVMPAQVATSKVFTRVTPAQSSSWGRVTQPSSIRSNPCRTSRSTRSSLVAPASRRRLDTGEPPEVFLLARTSKTVLFLLFGSLCAGCSAKGFATPYVLLENGYTVDPIWVALDMKGEVLFRKGSSTDVAQSPVLHLDQNQRLRLREAAELLRKLPGDEPERHRHECPGGEGTLSVGIYESPGVARWWSACISTLDESFEHLPRPFQEIVRLIREIPEGSYSPLFVLH